MPSSFVCYARRRTQGRAGQRIGSRLLDNRVNNWTCPPKKNSPELGDTILISVHPLFSSLASAVAGYDPTLLQAFQQNHRLPRLCLSSHDGVSSRSLLWTRHSEESPSNSQPFQEWDSPSPDRCLCLKCVPLRCSMDKPRDLFPSQPALD